MPHIIVIGSNGQLGSDLVKVLRQSPGNRVTGLTHADLDVTNFQEARAALSSLTPNVVLNTAAFHQVDKCEEQLDLTFTTNAFALKNLATVCKELDSVLVHFSTDYVFGHDQNRKIPYRESDLPGPVNAYGVSKLAGEHFIQYIAEKYFIIRVAGLFGVTGSSGKGGNFIETMLRIAREKGVVKVKDDEFTTPTSTSQVAANVRELIKTSHYGLYHMTSQGECSWHQFATEIFRQTATKVECIPVSSKEVVTFAKRPRYTVLDNAGLQRIGLDKMGSWQSALTKYLQDKNSDR